jgi:DNA-binding SARP family transcriptional activator
MIVLRALGAAEIATGKAKVTPSQSVLFAAGLYMIVERPKRVSRQRLSSVLWADIPPSSQAHRLRQTLYQLKNVGINIDADRHHLNLAADAATTDFDRVFRGGVGVSSEVRSLEFLPGYAPRLSEAFSRWLEQLRDRVHAELTRFIVSDLANARSRGAWGDVERLSSACLELDAYNEAAILARAEAFAMRGQKAAAIAVLDNYSRELGPGAQALELPASILRRRVLQHTGYRQTHSGVAKEPDFVGRAPEIATFNSMLDAARKGVGSGCLIEGEPGIGKTRLSSELATFAALQGFRVERIGCKRSDADQPLSAFVTLVPRLRDLPGAIGCSRSTITWLKRLTEFDASTSESAPSGEDPATLYTHVRSAVFDLLDAVSDERSLLIIAEDVQWLDRASASLFAAILEWIPTKKMLLLFNSRESANALTACVSRERLNIMRLAPLASAEAMTLLRTILLAFTPACEETTLNWLVATADGNPYFLQELVKYWLESGQTREVPPSIALVLDERLARLSGVAHQLLQACAVLAEHCSLERLERVFEYPTQELLAGLEELSRTGMLRWNAAGKEARGLVVRHDLLSIEILKSLSPASRAFLHRRCGMVLEQEALEPTASISLMRACAFHWHRSGDPERAYGLAVKCANYLLEIGLAADAAGAFEGALSFSSNPSNQLQILGRIIHANRMAGDRGALLSAIRRLRTVEESLGTICPHDDIELLELETLRITENELGPVLKRAKACVSNESLPAAHRVKLAIAAMKIATSLADLTELASIFFEIEPLLLDPGVDTGSRLQLQVIYHTMCGDLAKGVAFAEERVAFERTRGQTMPLLNAMADLAYVLRRTGLPDEMFSILRESYGIAIEHNHHVMARDAAEKLGALLEEAGRPASKEWMDRAVENARVASDVHGDFSFNADRARSALLGNRLEEARKFLDSGFDWEWLKDRRMWLAAAHALRVRLLIAEKASHAELRVHVDVMEGLYNVTASLGRQDVEIGALVLGFLELGEPVKARAYLEDYIGRTRRDTSAILPELKALARELTITVS